MSFHTFTLPEDRCVRLLVKNLGRVMPESVVREELESLNIRVQGVMQLRSGRREQDPTKDRLPPPLHCLGGARARGVKSAITHRTLRTASVGEDVRGPKMSLAMQALPALRTRAPVCRVWRLPPLRWVLYPARTASVLWLRREPHGQLKGLYQVERSERGCCKTSARACP